MFNYAQFERKNFRLLQASCDVAFEYAHLRKQFGEYLAKFQLIQVKQESKTLSAFFALSQYYLITLQGKIADMYTILSASRSYLYSVARSCDAGHINRKNCAAVFLYSAENATKAASDAIQILGKFIIGRKRSKLFENYLSEEKRRRYKIELDREIYKW